MTKIKRTWLVAGGEPMKTIKEDTFWYYPEDLEELLEPDVINRNTPKGYTVFITSYYHRVNTVIYFCRRN